MEEVLRPVLEGLARVAGLVWQRGWAESGAGNISVWLADTGFPKGDASTQRGTLLTPRPELAGQSFLVTATGSRMRDLVDDPTCGVGVVTVSEDGSGYFVSWQGTERFSPSSELPSHLAIHALRASTGGPCGAVLHAHPDELVALSLRKEFQNEKGLNETLMSVHPEAAVLIPEGVGLVPYLLPGSEELSDATFKAFRDHRVVIWANHGAISTGRDLDEAFDLMSIANKLAGILLVDGEGSALPGLSEEQVREIRGRFGK